MLDVTPGHGTWGFATKVHGCEIAWVNLQNYSRTNQVISEPNLYLIPFFFVCVWNLMKEL